MLACYYCTSLFSEGFHIIKTKYTVVTPLTLCQGQNTCIVERHKSGLTSLLMTGATTNDGSDANLIEIQRIVGLTDTELKRIISRIPQMKTYNPQTTQSCLTSIMERLNLTKQETKKKIILRLPQILGEYEYDTDIEPSLTLLQKRLLLSDNELQALILKCPQILGLDFDSDIWPKVQSVRSKLGLEDDNKRNIIQTKDEILSKPALLDVPVRGTASANRERKKE